MVSLYHHIERLGQTPGGVPSFAPGELCAAIDSFSLHAQVRVEAGNREGLEHLCSYVARPAIANERLSLSPEGKVVYELRHPWRDGTTHFVFHPLTFLERLAALVPRPREHMVTYHGVLAPASSCRDRIVPAPRVSYAAPPEIIHPVPRAAAVVAPQLISVSAAAAVVPQLTSVSHASHAYRWAELMRRVFEIDVLRCGTCGGRCKHIALISTPPVVRRILRHLNLPGEPPPVTPARPPPQKAFAY